MKDFRKLQVWEKAHRITLEVYRVTEDFPVHEQYRLTSQIRRASSSVPTNIAEGCGYRTDKEFRRFLQIALGSASEVEYLLLLTHELQFLTAEQYASLNSQITEIKRMLAGLINRMK